MSESLVGRGTRSRAGAGRVAFDALYVFAVAARHLSFTSAARELHRTQSAVSHRIKELERQIGMPLFERTVHGLELTTVGETIAHKVNHAVAEITGTLTDLRRARESRKLRVTLLPSFASRWLVPRLPIFRQQYPRVQVEVIADSRVLDLRVEGIDLAIRFGQGRYRGYSSSLLMEDCVLPVCSPRLLTRRGSIRSIDALLELPLLHDAGAEGDESLSDWHSWLDQLRRVDLPCHAGQRFSHAGLLIEAAVHGLGVALGRLSLVTDHLTAGTLVSPCPLATPTAYQYHVVGLPERMASREVADFVQWLRGEAEAITAIAARIRRQEKRFRSGADRLP
jgi:LysR family transcriptional regulator, glycine cleavage system transcriptional activator